MSSFDLVTMGRIGVDLYPEQIGVPLEEVQSFRKMLGGGPTNVAVAAALGPMLWDEPRAIGEWNRRALRFATVAVGNRAEVAATVGDAEPGELADRLLRLGLRLAVVKLGPEGVPAASSAGALVATRLGCADEMPTEAEVEALAASPVTP